MIAFAGLTRRSFLISVPALAMAGCTKPSGHDAAILDRAEQVYVDLVSARYDKLIPQLPPGISEASYRESLIQMRDRAPSGTAGPPTLVGWSSDAASLKPGKTIIFRYDYPDRSILAHIRFAGSDKLGWTLYRLEILPVEKGKAYPALAKGKRSPPPIVRTALAGS